MTEKSKKILLKLIKKTFKPLSEKLIKHLDNDISNQEEIKISLERIEKKLDLIYEAQTFKKPFEKKKIARA